MQLCGLAGTDVTINAPLGVTVLTDEGEVLGDLTTNHQTITVAQGTGLGWYLFFLQMILYGGLVINKLQFLITKNINFFQLFFSFNFWSSKPPYPDSLEMLDPDPYPGANVLRIYRILIQRSWAILPPKIKPSQSRKVRRHWWYLFFVYKWSFMEA
jgi:hypothetical protein